MVFPVRIVTRIVKPISVLRRGALRASECRAEAIRHGGSRTREQRPPNSLITILAVAGICYVMDKSLISRRGFLRGFGAALSLPAFESFRLLMAA